MTVTHLRSTSGLVLVFPGTELVTRALVRMRSGRRAARTGLVSDESTAEEEEEDSGAAMCVSQFPHSLMSLSGSRHHQHSYRVSPADKVPLGDMLHIFAGSSFPLPLCVSIL